MALIWTQHWFQIINEKKFHHYKAVAGGHNCGVSFPTKQVTTPIHLYCGTDDGLSNVPFLRDLLPEGVQIDMVPGFGHLDFLYARTAYELVWTHVVSVLDKHFDKGK